MLDHGSLLCRGFRQRRVGIYIWRFPMSASGFMRAWGARRRQEIRETTDVPTPVKIA